MSTTTNRHHVHLSRPSHFRLLAASLCLVALLATLAVVLTLAPNARAGTAAPQPAELQALEQRMSEVTVNSERFTGSVSVGGKLPHKLSALRGLKASFTGEHVLAPPATRVTTKLLGKPLTLLQIGESLYVNEPALARRDGGRPWVELDLAGRSKLFGSSPGLGSGTGLSGTSGGSGQAFKDDAELLKDAAEVHALGTSMVDGQTVSGFSGTVSAAKLAQGQLPKKTLQTLRSKHIKLSASIEAFIASSGVPVRVSLTLRLGKAIRVSVLSDTLAINFPVAAVPPPPAGETITAAELAKLEKKSKPKQK
ncbi:MAG TPA: hypothetical protein VK774_09770 [Solirubrobacteraceae bacterium]|jgi:hypothetical protein|nr:hypothetical protein [Solirubrobacteraceae bacterium]